MRQARTVLVTGASGYIGGRLIPELLAAGYSVRALARDPRKLQIHEWVDDVEVVRGDVRDEDSLRGAMDDVDAVYYLVRSMGGSTSFEQADREAAETFRDARQTRGYAGSSTWAGSGATTTRPCHRT